MYVSCNVWELCSLNAFATWRGSETLVLLIWRQLNEFCGVPLSCLIRVQNLVGVLNLCFYIFYSVVQVYIVTVLEAVKNASSEYITTVLRVVESG